MRRMSLGLAGVLLALVPIGCLLAAHFHTKHTAACCSARICAIAHHHHWSCSAYLVPVGNAWAPVVHLELGSWHASSRPGLSPRGIQPNAFISSTGFFISACRFSSSRSRDHDYSQPPPRIRTAGDSSPAPHRSVATSPRPRPARLLSSKRSRPCAAFPGYRCGAEAPWTATSYPALLLDGRTFPCQRFDAALASSSAWLGADVGR